MKRSSLKIVVMISAFFIFFTLFGTIILFEDPGSNTGIDTNYTYDSINNMLGSSTRSIQPRSNNDWIMHLYGPAHNSYTTAFGPTNSNVLWYNTTGDTTYSSPCIADGRVFIGVGSSMKCYFENNGTLNWTLSPINVAGGLGVCSSPAYANDCIYFGADKIYCVWATNGTIRWVVNKPNIKHGDGSPTLANGKVFITGSDYKLYCIDQLTGSVYWTFQALSDYPPAIPDNWGLYAAPAVVNGRVFLAACDWYLYQINETQPTSVATANHTFQMGWASYSSPVVVGDKVYVGCSYIDTNTVSRYYCFWASNLTKIWEFYPGAATGFFGSAGYYNGKIYVGSIDGNLYCLNATNGAEVWKYDIGGTWSSPAVTNERLYIGSKTGYIYCFNLTQPATPDYYWRYLITGEVDCSPSVVPGRVYIGTHGNSGRVYCFGTKDLVPPQITDTYPVNGGTDIPSTANINGTFNEPINSATLTNSSFNLKDSGSNPVSGIVTYEPLTRTATFDPDIDLKKGELYTATITTAVQDNWGNTLDGNKNSLAEASPIDDYSWTFTTSLNNPPELSNMTVTPTKGDLTTEFEYSVVYTDLDNDTPELIPAYIRVHLDDELIGREMSLNASAAPHLRDGIFTNGEQYIYQTTMASYELHSYKFIGFDGVDFNESDKFYNPLVQAKPVIDHIQDAIAYEDEDMVMDLSNTIHDDDTNISDLILTVNSSYGVVDDFNITFNYPNEFNYPSGRTYEIVAINVTDGAHNASHEIRIDVIAVNDAPQVSGIPNIQLKENENYTIDVTGNIADVDNELDELTISTNSSYAVVVDKKITFYYPIGTGILYEYVIIEVNDGELTRHQNITVTIIPEGVLFVLSPIPDQNAIEDIDLRINMADYIATYNDLDFNDFELEFNSSYGTVSGMELVFNYPNSFNYPSGCTYEIVQVNVTYGDQTDRQSFKINVEPVNDGPTLTAVQAPQLALSNIPIRFEVDYLDIDGGEHPLVELVIEGTGHRMSHISGNIHLEGGRYNLELKLTVGEYHYYYHSNDQENAINSVYSTDTYTLKVIEYSEIGEDTDGDSLPDAWELKYGLDPFDPNDASGDPDGDNYTNLQEFLGIDGKPGGGDSTDPWDPLDIPVEPEDEDDDENEGAEDSDFSNFALAVIAIVIIIVVIIVAIFLFGMRSSKTEIDGEEPGYEPSYYSPDQKPPAVAVPLEQRTEQQPPVTVMAPMATPVTVGDSKPESSSEQELEEE